MPISHFRPGNPGTNDLQMVTFVTFLDDTISACVDNSSAMLFGNESAFRIGDRCVHYTVVFSDGTNTDFTRSSSQNRASLDPVSTDISTHKLPL